MSGIASTRWYFPDWMSDTGVRACSLAARGLWMDLLCIAGTNHGREYGFILIAGKKPTSGDLARLLGSTEQEIETLLDELRHNGVFSEDRRLVIYSRRMVRAEKYRGNGRLGTPDKPLSGKENKKRGVPPVVPVPRPVERKVPEPRSGLFDGPPWPKDYRDQFWRLYPRHTEKKAAMKKLDAIRLAGTVEWTRLLEGVERLRAHVAVHRTEQQYIKHPTTWLNRGCWDDELPSEPNGGPNGTHRNGSTTGGFAHNVADFINGSGQGDAAHLGPEEPAGLVQEIY